MTTENPAATGVQPAPKEAVIAPGDLPKNPYAFDDVTFGAQRTAEVDSVLADVLKALEPTPAAAPATQAQGDEPKEAPAAPPLPTVENVAPPPEPVKAPEEPDRGMLRLLEREGVVRDRESAAERRERELEARERALTSKSALDPETVRRAIEDDPETVRRAIEDDPLKFFGETVGLDAEQVSRLIIYKKLGDKTPAEIRKALEQYEVRKEIRDLKAQNAQKDYQVAVETVRTGVAAYAPKLVGDSTYPALAAVAAVNPDMVAQEIFSEIARDADAKGIGPTDKRLMSHAEAAKAVEARWNVFRQAFAPAQPPPAPTTPAPQAPPPPAKTAPQGSNVNSNSPPPPPRRSTYWSGDRDAEVAAALAEATQIALRS